MKKISSFVIVALLGYYGISYFNSQTLSNPQTTVAQPTANPIKAANNKNSYPESNSQAAQDKILQDAFTARTNNLLVTGRGTVIKTLADDTKGSQHQRFIIKTTSGQTLLIAHNIDLAPRINHLNIGDHVEFKGEYEWNKKGGIIHWTHHDPRGKHPDGWLQHQERLYQ